MYYIFNIQLSMFTYFYDYILLKSWKNTAIVCLNKGKNIAIYGFILVLSVQCTLYI